MQGKKFDLTPRDADEMGEIESAVAERDYYEARYQAALKVARAMDETDSARDVKALSRELSTLLAELKNDDRVKARNSDGTPLAEILKMAQE